MSHMFFGDDEPEYWDIGHGVVLTPLYRGPDLVSFDWIHPRLDNSEKCPGYIVLDTDHPQWLVNEKRVWHLESEEPLTVSPSLLCTACGNHGWIREGSWIPA